MDPLTHGLASFALQRTFFPRVSWRGVVVIVAAGIVADVDSLTAVLGPAQFLRWHRTMTHSIIFVVVLALAALAFYRATRSAASNSWLGFSWISIAAAAGLHLLLDVPQADSVEPLWPFSSRRVALDLLPHFDLWLLTIFAAAILLPELFRLVNEEIGSRSKTPRGRNGAIAGFAIAALYLGMRLLSHSNAVASLNANTIAGETPRRVAAFPGSTSPFLWHTVVETQSTLNLVILRSGLGEVSYASGVTTLHKPEPSPVLAAAQASPAATAFIKVARFPKATVQKETEGYSVEIQDLKDQATEETSRAVFADINLDKNSRVVSAELRWQKNSSGPK